MAIRILIADDSDLTLLGARMVLESDHRYLVTDAVRSLDDLADAVGRCEPDVIVCSEWLADADVLLVLERLRPDFNVPKIFRSAQAFGAHSVHLVDIGPFDPAPGKGAFKHVPARFHAGFEACRDALLGEGFGLVALDPHAPTPLPDAELPQRCAFILGHESEGLSSRVLDDPAVTRVAIPNLGTLDSLNELDFHLIFLWGTGRINSHGEWMTSAIKQCSPHAVCGCFLNKARYRDTSTRHDNLNSPRTRFRRDSATGAGRG